MMNEDNAILSKRRIITIIVTLLFYLLLLTLYLQDVINEFIFAGSLLLGLMGLFIVLIVQRKNKATIRTIGISTFIISVLFCYELPLTLYYISPSHLAYSYKEPAEALKGTRIFLLGVNELAITNGKSKRKLKCF